MRVNAAPHSLFLKLYPTRASSRGPLPWTLEVLFPAQGLLSGCTLAATWIPSLRLPSHPCSQDLSQGLDPSLLSLSGMHLRLHPGLTSGLPRSPHTWGLPEGRSRVRPGRAC